MSVLRWFVVASGMALLMGCVAATNPGAVAEGTKTTFNPHTGMNETSGAVSPINGNIFQGFFMIRSFRHGAGPELHQIYLAVSNGDWMFLNAAHAYGKPLQFVAIDRQVGSCSRYGCTVTETVGVNLSDQQLAEYSRTGLVFQLSGQRGSRVVTIPSTYFQGYRSRLPGGQGIPISSDGLKAEVSAPENTFQGKIQRWGNLNNQCNSGSSKACSERSEYEGKMRESGLCRKKNASGYLIWGDC